MIKEITSLSCLLLLYSINWAQTSPVEIKADHFSTLLTTGDYATVITFFDASVSDKITTEQLSQIWTQMQVQCGDYKKKQAVRMVENEDKNVLTTLQPIEFANTTLDLKLIFTLEEKITGFFFVAHQEAELQLSETAFYKEKEIAVIGDADFPLRGILTYPKNKTNVPAIILVHGSGASDMNETYRNHQLFKDLAQGLAEKGIAVIRYDKRTFAHGQSNKLDRDKITLYDETIEDAVAATKLAAKTEGIDPKNIFVLGHSLGGMAAPRIAQLSKNTKGIIIMAGNARPLEAVILDQLNYIFGQNGTISPEEKMALEDFNNQLKALEVLREKGKTVGTLPLGASAAYWTYLLKYDQLTTAEKLKKPILVIQGGRDYQVSLKDYELWKARLGAKTNVKFQVFEKLNHLMFEGEGLSYPDEYDLDGKVPNYVIDTILNWILSPS